MVAKRKLQNLHPHPQTTRHNVNSLLQIPFAQTWSNPYHSFINGGTMQTSSIVTHSHKTQDQDMRSVYGTMQTSSIVTPIHKTQDQDMRSIYGTMQTSSNVTPSHKTQDQDMRSVYGTMQTSSIVTPSHITQDQDTRSVYGTDLGERARDSMLLSYSGGHMNSSVASNSMPVWLRQPRQASHGSRFALDLDFLRSRMGEDTSSKSCKTFDAKDLSLQL
ncbi:hypothetical protein Tco_1330344 [Tanacetum coccineum]